MIHSGASKLWTVDRDERQDDAQISISLTVPVWIELWIQYHVVYGNERAAYRVTLSADRDRNRETSSTEELGVQETHKYKYAHALVCLGGCLYGTVDARHSI